jgi:hypothetical protein
MILASDFPLKQSARQRIGVAENIFEFAVSYYWLTSCAIFVDEARGADYWVAGWAILGVLQTATKRPENGVVNKGSAK